MAPKDTSCILEGLRKAMKDRKYVQEPLQAYIIPSCDAHNSEYLAKVDKRREYVSGFSGSAGSVVVTPGKALLWTDGRYHLQATKELDSNWTLMKDGLPETPSQGDWLASTLSGGNVGVDPLLMSGTSWSTLSDKLEMCGSQLVAVTTNLVDLVWAADASDPQPPRPDNPVQPQLLQFTGKAWEQKVGEVRAVMKEKGAGLLILSALDDVAWLLNLRGSDIVYNPVFFSYCAVSEKEVVLFINPSQVSENVREALGCSPPNGEMCGERVVFQSYSSDTVREYMKQWLGEEAEGKVWLSDTASQGLASVVPAKRRLSRLTPVASMKAIKTEAEIRGFDASHARDSAALCMYFSWLEKNVESQEVTEITGADKLEQFRRQQENFVGLSFDTISSVGPNGAIIHYRPSPETARRITKTELYLLDSGAQYLDGTTDVTRTVHLGTPSQHQKDCFTRVLKGMIGLAASVFPNKTKGHCLDSWARKYLWEVGLDYMHGTGHGVGSYLNVHEGPCGISWRVYPNDPGLQAGMILSDEPGYYEEGAFGIRIETLVRVVEAEVKGQAQGLTKGPFLTFCPVTVVPIQAKMITAELLTRQEIEWLNNYHELCRERVGPLLKELGWQDAYEWLYRETQPIG